MPSARWLVLVLLFPLLCACAHPYHTLSSGVGFSELPIGPDTFQISFAGDSATHIAEARRYAYLRAAELAALRNEPYFQVLSEQIYVTWGYQYWPGTNYAYAGGYYGRHRPYVYQYYEPGYVEPYSLPDVILQVQLLASPGPATIPAAYLLRQAVADKIQLSPGVAERLPTLPEVTTPVTLPPQPPPTTKPAVAPPPPTNPMPPPAPPAYRPPTPPT
jgi:hypothetical protein